MEIKHNRMYFGAAAAAFTLFAACAASGAEGAPVLGSMGGVLTPDMKTTVTLTCEGENALGTEVFLAMRTGSGDTVSDGGSALSCPWSFSLERDSVRVTLYDENGSYYFEPAYTTEEGRVLILMCAENQDWQAAVSSDADLGTAQVSFSMDMSGIDRCVVEATASLECAGLPEGGSGRLISGLYPLEEALWCADGAQTAFSVSETGYMILQVPLRAGMDTTYFTPSAGDVRFTASDGEGWAASEKCGEDGTAVLSLDMPGAFSGGAKTYTVTEEVLSPYLTPSEGEYTLTYGGGSLEKSTEGWRGSVPVRVMDSEGSAVSETVLGAIFSWNEDGTMEAGVIGEVPEVIFENAYRALGEAVISGRVSLPARFIPARADEFTLILMQDGKEIGRTATNAGGTFAFDPIICDYTDIGEKHYTVVQEKGDVNGVIYDENEYEVTLTVRSEGGGKLAVESSGTVVFVNDYTASGTLELPVSTSFSGRWLKAGELTYGLFEGQDLVASASADAGGTAVIRVPYTLDDIREGKGAGMRSNTKTYRVRLLTEDSDLPGIRADRGAISVRVTLTDRSNGIIECTFEPEASNIVFSHVYAAKGTLDVTGTVSFTEGDMTPGRFSFVIREDDRTVATGVNDAEGNIVFQPIKYTQNDVGSHTLVVSQYTAETDSVFLDNRTYTLDVDVKDAGDGTLDISCIVKDSPDGRVTFENGYHASGVFRPEAAMTLTGRAIGENEYLFQILTGPDVISQAYASPDGSVVFSSISYTLADLGAHYYTIRAAAPFQPGVTLGTVEYPIVVNVTDTGLGFLKVEPAGKAPVFEFVYSASGSYSARARVALTGRGISAGEMTFALLENNVTVSTGSADGNGVIRFDPVNYTVRDVGTHEYTCVQTQTVPGGVVRDETAHTVRVNVKDNGDGTLGVSAEGGDDIVFACSYEARGSYAPQARVFLENAALTEGQFAFEILENDHVIRTKQNRADGLIEFSQIDYTSADVGRHVYAVRQSGLELGGIHLDRSVAELVVNVSDNGDGTLTVERTSGDIRFNNEYRTVGTAYMNGRVILSGRAVREGEFAFEIKCGDRVISTGTNGADGKIAFSDLVFTQDDLVPVDGLLASENTLSLTASMKPVAEGTGLTGDETEFTFTVGLRDLGNGTMSVNKSPEAENIVFHAAYESAGETVISGSVNTAEYTPAEGDFTFLLLENGAEIARASNNTDGTFAFPAVHYTVKDAGRHTYTVAQKSGDLPGMIYDSGTFDVTVEVSDDGLGTMSAVNASAAPVFENRLARIGEMTLSTSLGLTGREVREGEFTFALTEDGEQKATAANDSEGRVTFLVPLGSEDAGEHRYEAGVLSMPEGAELLSGGSSWTVEARPDGTGRMSWWVKDEVSEPFEIAYSARGEIAIVCESHLTGRTAEGGMFTYALSSPDGVIDTKTAGEDGTVVFDPIKFGETDGGEREYTIAQTTPDMSGYTLDRQTAVVTVTAEDAGDGTMKVTQSAVPVFNNAYRASGMAEISVRAEVSGRAVAEGEFVYILEENGTEIGRKANDEKGRALLARLDYTQDDAGEHTYTIRPAAPADASLTLLGEETAAVKVTCTDNGDGTMTVTFPEETVYSYTYRASGALEIGVRASMSGREIREGEITYILTEGGNTLSTASVDKNGLAVFPQVMFDEGTGAEREFTLKLQGALPGGVSGDESAVIKARASDDGKGTITVKTDRTVPVEMNYIYAPTGRAQIVCAVTCERVTFGEGDFTLILLDEGGRQVSAVNEEDGTVFFPEIDYALKDVGEHIYWVQQEKGTKSGVVYDDSVHQVTVSVSEGTGGVLLCEVSGKPVFANGYFASGEAEISASISCTGFEPGAGVVKLTLIRDGVTVAEGTNDSEGRVVFSPVPFTGNDVGTHEFLIYASSEAYSGMAAPEDGVPVKVTVSDNNDGTLSFSADREPVIPLSYLSAGYARVEVSVKLNGREMKDGEFAFALVENDSVVATSRSDKDGSAGFDIFYDTDDTGVHTYQVMQLDTNQEGVTTQNSRYNVKVNVTDLGTGEIETRVEYPESGITFVNTYTALGELNVKAQVLLSGREMTEGEFTLALYRGEEKLLTAACDAEGAVTFAAIPLSVEDVGLLSLELAQIPGNEAGIVYDDTVYPLLVTVKDDGKGGVACEYAAPPAFRNSYEAHGQAVITSEVNLIGRALSEGSFTLTLYENGQALQQKKNDAEGVVTFDPITYDIGDVGAHIYEIAETATSEAGVPLSEEKQIVTVKVSDAGAGRLEAVADGSGYVFHNSFTANASLTVRAALDVTGSSTGESPRMILTDSDGNVVEEITAVEGVNVFSPIVFTQADAGKRFVYTVCCTDVESEYTVEAAVSDALDGRLNVTETIRGSEGLTDGIRFRIEYALELRISLTGAREALPCTVTLMSDGVALKGEYPVTGASEDKITSGGTLTIKPDTTAVISDLPTGTYYKVTCSTGQRYDVKITGSEGMLIENLECGLECTFRTTEFRIRAEFTDENGTVSNVTGDQALWMLYSNGNETANRFEADGSEYVVTGLPYADTEGRAIEYSARALPGSGITVTYVNTGDYADNTDEVYSGGTVQLRRGMVFSVRVRFTEGGDEPVYTFRTVSAVLYSEEGKVGDVSLIPDESGWCRLNGLDTEHEYYVVPSGVNGYSSSNRNAGKYGNVTRYLYDGGTATYIAVNEAGASKRQILMYAGAGIAALGAGGGAVYALRKRRRK